METMGRWYRHDVRRKRVQKPRVHPKPWKKTVGVLTYLQEDLEWKFYPRWDASWGAIHQELLTWNLWHDVQRSSPSTPAYTMKALSLIVAQVLHGFCIDLDKEADIATRLYTQRQRLNRTFL